MEVSTGKNLISQQNESDCLVFGQSPFSHEGPTAEATGSKYHNLSLTVIKGLALILYILISCHHFFYGANRFGNHQHRSEMR